MMNKLFVLLAALISSTANAAVSDVDRAILDRGKQLLLNGGFESGKASWTASGGTFATTTTAANVGFGAVAASWNSSAASQTLVSSLVSIPSGLKSGNGFAYCRFKAASGTATHTITVDDGTNNLVAPQTIVSSTSDYKGIGFNFIYPSSGQVRIKIASVAADEPEIFIDDCFVGDAINVGSVAQAKLIGSIKMTACAAQWGTTSTTFANFGVQTGCTYTVTGDALAPTTMIPAIRFATLPAGQYRIEYQGSLRSPSNTTIWTRFSDGTNVTNEESVMGDASGTSTFQHYNGISHTIAYTSPQSNVTLQIQAKVTANTGYVGGTTTYPGVINVWYYPTSTQQVFNPLVDGWKVDASISGGNPSLGASSISSYTGIESSTLTLTNNSGNGNIPAQIPCSSTNAPSGTTCSVGNESVGVSFNLPKAGDVMACASFAHYAARGGTNGDSVQSIFQIVETPNNAQTISQEGKSRVQSGTQQNPTNPDNPSAVTHPIRVCGNFTFASSGQKTLRLMYEQLVGGTASATVFADADTTQGQRDIHWEVYPISQLTPAPVLVGSVSSGTSGAERIERVRFVCGTSSSITDQSGSWVSITSGSTGRCTLNYSGVFSSAPSCSLTYRGNARNIGWVQLETSEGLNSASVYVADGSTAFNNQPISAICMGAK